MSDRIAVMRAGRIEQLDAPAAIYAEPASAYVASFIGQQNFVHGTVRAAGNAVDTAIGAISGRWGGERVAAGQPAVAAIRPEYIRLEQGEGAGVPGRVLGVSHLGETLQVAVRIGEDATFLSRMPAPTAPSVGVDDVVRCVWSPADARLFAAEGIPTTATHVITLPKDGGR